MLLGPFDEKAIVDEEEEVLARPYALASEGESVAKRNDRVRATESELRTFQFLLDRR